MIAHTFVLAVYRLTMVTTNKCNKVKSHICSRPINRLGNKYRGMKSLGLCTGEHSPDTISIQASCTVELLLFC